MNSRFNASSSDTPKAPSDAIQGPAALDLGLGDILRGSGEVAMPPTVEPVEPSKGINAPMQPEDPWAELAASGKWQEIIDRAEKTPNGENIEALRARLWWVKSQRELGSLPVTILAAPLDSVTASLADFSQRPEGVEPKLAALASDLLTSVGNDLKQRHDHLLALTLLERVVLFRPEAADALKQYASELLTLEGGMQRFIKDPLREKLTQIATRTGAVAQKNQLAPSGVPSNPGESANRSTSSPKVGGAFFTFATASIALVIVVFGIAELRRVTPLPSEKPPFEFSSVLPEILPPALDRMLPLNTLLALSYEINRTDAVKTGQTPPQKQQREIATVTERVATKSADPVLVAKEAVNTTGPIEPPDFAKITAEVKEPEPDIGDVLFGEAQPKFPRAAEKNTPRPSLRDRYGQPRNDSGFDDAVGVEFTKYDEPRFFKVIVATNVTHRPSFRTVVLDRLAPGDRIRAEARVGDWYKLRSKNGQVGYVLAQDVKGVEQ